MGIANSLEKDTDAGKDWGQEEKGAAKDEMVSSITHSMDMNLSKFQEIVKDREAWCAAVHMVAKSWTQLSDWTTIVPSNGHNHMLSSLTHSF